MTEITPIEFVIEFVTITITITAAAGATVIQFV